MREVQAIETVQHRSERSRGAARLAKSGRPRASTASLQRDGVIAASALNVIAGLWLVVAPWALAYLAARSRWNDVACGGVVALLALARIGGAYRWSWLSLFNALIGAWLVVAAMTLDGSGELANDAIIGAVISLCAVRSASASDTPSGAPHETYRAPRSSTRSETAPRFSRHRPPERLPAPAEGHPRTRRPTRLRPPNPRLDRGGCAGDRSLATGANDAHPNPL
jgi:uncharacterized membrane protein YhaH (DUF805 family)